MKTCPRLPFPNIADMREHLPTWAYYSEDGGLQGCADPELILIVDPIDGTRPAAAGFEMACVSIAAVPPLAAPTMGDVMKGYASKDGLTWVKWRGPSFALSAARPTRRKSRARRPTRRSRASAPRGMAGWPGGRGRL